MAAISTLLLAAFSIFCDVFDIPISSDEKSPNIVQQADIILAENPEKQETKNSLQSPEELKR